MGVKQPRAIVRACLGACLAFAAAAVLAWAAAAPAAPAETGAVPGKKTVTPQSQTQIQPEAVQSVPRIQLTVGKSIVLKAKYNIGKASVADDKIADIAAPMLPGQNRTNQVYVAGKAPGLTTLTLWDEADQVRNVYDIEVSPDLTRLKKMIHSIMPDETGIEVHNNNDAIALSGQVKSAVNLQKAVSLAESYAPGKVINLMSVGGVHQVMLEVRVAEMNRSLLRHLGVNINYLFQGDFVYTMLGGLTSVPLLTNLLTTYTTTNPNGTMSTPAGFQGQGPAKWASAVDPYNKDNSPSRFDPQKSPLNITQNVNAMANINTNINGQHITWTGFLNLLKDNGLIKILAEPTLVCLNGQTAEFLAGGELPVPIPQALGSITIEWKKFGVELAFTPTVLANNRISLKVAPSVSDLDFTRAITVSGFQIPTINKRSASTVIEMDDGQSFAIAGLLREDIRSTSSKYPALGDVPVLGALFKSDDFQKSQSELVIIITPRLARPMDKSITKLPTDGVREPTDLEFYLNMPPAGKTTSKTPVTSTPATGGPAAARGGLDGDFGHAVPDLTQSGSAGAR